LLKRPIDPAHVSCPSFDLTQLIGESLDRTATVSDYFANVPEAAIDSEAFTILSARDIYSHAKTVIPCCYTVEFGFVPIATELSGDTFTVDVTDGRVFLLSHEKYGSDGIHPGWNDDCSAFLPTRSVNRESIIDTCEATWDSIADFLDECLSQTMER